MQHLLYAQRGVNAVWLGDYERAVVLIEKGLLKYDPTFIRGRARLVAQKAEALYRLQHISECAMIAEEALVLARSVHVNENDCPRQACCMRR